MMSSFATGLLAGLAFFVVLPEAWAEAGPLVLAGWLLLWLVDRFLYPLCRHCGGAGPWPLWIALGTHSFLDGALLALARPGSLAAWGLLLHRIPELAAMYGLLRETPRVLWQIGIFQAVCFVGYLGAAALDPLLLRQGYALGAGALVFLGWHRVHRSWHEARLDWVPLGAGLCAMGAVHWII